MEHSSMNIKMAVLNKPKFPYLRECCHPWGNHPGMFIPFFPNDTTVVQMVS